MPGDTRVIEDDFSPINSKQERGEADADASISLPMNEKENSTRENNVAKIKVVVCQSFIGFPKWLIHSILNIFIVELKCKFCFINI